MANEIIRPDGSILKPIKMGEFIELTDKQLAKIQDNVRFNAYDGINSAIMLYTITIASTTSSIRRTHL